MYLITNTSYKINMKKNVIRGILAGAITFFACSCIVLALEYHKLDTKYQNHQKSVDDMFLDYISDIDIETNDTLKDDVLFGSYFATYEKLNFAESIYDLTSYKDKQVNSSDQESEINIEPVLKRTKLYIYEKANEKERIDTDKVEFICESLKNIAENIENAEKCNEYIDELYEKLD